MSVITAAELGGAHIGRVIRARVHDETVIQDEVAGLIHQADNTLVKFTHVSPNSADPRIFGAMGFQLDHDESVKVIEA